VAHRQDCHGVSKRRACRVIDAGRKNVRLRSTKGDDAGLRMELRERGNHCRRLGYRGLHILMRRKGVIINRKKSQRLYQEKGLIVMLAPRSPPGSRLATGRYRTRLLATQLWRRSLSNWICNGLLH
jgi:hypothetical protein